MISHKDNAVLYILFFLLVVLITTPYASASDSSCTSCHENVRHSLIDEDCLNCHIDDVADGKHTDMAGYVQNVHEDFDWENDNEGESEEDRKSESCSVCHRSSTVGDFNVCENCHLPDESDLFRGPSSGLITLRSDINETIVRVYAHTNFSTIYVSDQSDLGGSKSTCFGFSLITGEGICHGVQYQMKEKAGGYFAHNMSNSGSAKRSNPYMETNTIDNLPDTSDCMFCHVQEDPSIRKAWGDAKELPADHKSKKSSDCWDCHVIGGKKPPSFHSELVVMSTENSGLLGSMKYLFVVVLFIVGIFAYLHKKQQK